VFNKRHVWYKVTIASNLDTSIRKSPSRAYYEPVVFGANRDTWMQSHRLQSTSEPDPVHDGLQPQ